MIIQVKKVTTVPKNQKIQKRDRGQILQIVKRMIPHGARRSRNVHTCLHRHCPLNSPKLLKEKAVITTVSKNLINLR